jgi:SAM-dependent methyltransferase
MNARNLGLSTGTFDIALSGFMGWYDCFDFVRFEFTQPDTKAKEIRRVLKDGGRFVCCSWERQEDLSWMEEAFIRHNPAILEDQEYLERRPIGMAYEKARGYEIILREAGFRDMEVFTEAAEFVSTDEEEWWRQMREVGWSSFFEKLEKDPSGRLQRIKDAIFEDLQPFKQPDGIHFTKSVFFVYGVK